MSNDPATVSAARDRDQAPQTFNIHEAARVAQANRCMALEEEIQDARSSCDSKEEVLQELSKREYAHQVAAQNSHDLRIIFQRENERLRAEIVALKAENASLRAQVKPKYSIIDVETGRRKRFYSTLEMTPAEFEQWGLADTDVESLR